MSVVCDNNLENVIPNWICKIDKPICEDNVLSSHFPKSSRDAGFFFDESKEFVVGAKLRFLGKECTSVNQMMENGDIRVAAGKNQSFSELDCVLLKNLEQNVWIAVQGMPDGVGKYVFKGYYKYKKKDGLKYLIEPINRNDTGDVSPSKRLKTNHCDSDASVYCRRPFYNGMRYDSKTEASYAVFMNFFQIPFINQSDTGVLNTKLNYSSYVIDFEVYPQDLKRKFFIEVKPFKPSLWEEELCEKVAFVKRVPVYIFYGSFGVPFSIGNDFPTGYSVVSFTYEDGMVKRDEGYCFMENNGEIFVDKLCSTSNLSFLTSKLKKAYEHTMNFEFTY